MKTNILLILVLILLASAKAQKNLEPDIKEIYYTNKAGDKITEMPSVKEKVVFLNIVSVGSIGKEALLTMDKGEMFFYKKEFLPGGSSISFIIENDLEIFKLTIYNPKKKKHVKRRMAIEGYEEAEDAQEAFED